MVKMKKLMKLALGGIFVLSLAVASLDAAEVTIEVPGSRAFGPGDKTGGWFTIDGLELSQTSVAFGTVGSNIALDPSSTYYIEAWVVVVGPTQTTLAASYFPTGTFRRDGTGATTVIGSGTRARAETADAVNLEAYLAANVNGVDVRVVGSAATEIDWAAHVRYIKVTTDGT